MIVARLEAFSSLPLAPTRRIALGMQLLPVDPAPGYGGALVAGVVAKFAAGMSPDQIEEIDRLRGDVGRRQRPVQPRVRHRLQADRIGLRRLRHRLIADGPRLSFQFDEERGTPTQHVLAAVYAAGEAPPGEREVLLDCVAAGLRWSGPVDATLIHALSSAEMRAFAQGDAIGWARRILGLDPLVSDRVVVQRAFRERVRSAHPDHGAEHSGAAERIAELNEARRILLAMAS